MIEAGPGLEAIRQARERIGDQLVDTPCTRSLVFSDLSDGDLHFKFENFQRTGSFKERGALNRLHFLDAEQRRHGVVAASAGNHAQALAYHATRLGIPVQVVMPETTPLVKVSNTRRYGARVILHGNTFAEALARARELEAEGALRIDAFDDEAIIAGQGTIGLELHEQCPGVDLVLVPIGGGGLISGIALALKKLEPSARIVGVEAEAAPTASRSLAAGRIMEVEQGGETIADGIAVKRVGERTFPLIQELVDDVVVVDDEEIASAILLLLEREKTMVEGAGATTLAALATGKVRVDSGDTVVAVLSGGNIDVNILSRIIDRGLVRDGRLARFVVTVRDRPGALARVTRLVADAGANVLEVAHHRASADLSVRDVRIVLGVETRGADHVQEIVTRLKEEGIPVESLV